MRILAILLFTLVSFSSYAGIGQWSSTDTNNNGAAPLGWETNMSPANVKLIGRRMMSFTHQFYLDAQWISEEVSPTWINTTTFTVSTSDPTFYHVNRRVKTQDAVGLNYGTISAASAIGATGASVTIIPDSGTISNTLFKVWIGAVSGISSSVTSSSLGLGTIGTVDTIISNTTSVKAISGTGTVSVTAAGTNSAWFTSSGLNVSGTISTTNALGTVSATFGNFSNVSATNTNQNTAIANNISASVITATTVNGVSLVSSSLPRAWGYFNGTGSSIFKGYNIASFTRIGGGDYGVSFTTPMPDATYLPVCMALSAAANQVIINGTQSTSPTAAGFRVQARNDAGGALDTAFSCVVFD